MKEYIVGCESYDFEQINSLCDKSEIKGVILGDLFCQKRMFNNGIADLILLTQRVLLSKKKVIYQAPLYVTSRNLNEVKSILNLMDGYEKESYVIVQDFGTAELVNREYNNIQLIWGQLGRVRELRYSDDFLMFLRKKAFAGMETGDKEIVERMISFGLIPFFNNAVLKYRTLGRNCYLEYQTGRCEPALCHSGCYSLKAKNEEFEMTIDGYMLGKKYQMIPEKTFKMICNEYNVEPILRREL